MACNDQKASNPTNQATAEEKHEITEMISQDEQQKDTINTPKSTRQLLEESQQLGKEVWEKSKESGEQLLDKSKNSSDEILQKSKKTTDELWQATKENSRDIWLDTQESSAKAWDDMKDTGKQVWLDGNQALETLMKTKEQTTESEKEKETKIQLPDDET